MQMQEAKFGVFTNGVGHTQHSFDTPINGDESAGVLPNRSPLSPFN